MTQILKVFRSVTDLQDTPGQRIQIGRRDSQLLYGEHFAVDRVDGGWAVGHGVLDGYPGHVDINALTPQGEAPTHIVTALMTHAYPAPNFKVRPALSLSFMSRVHVDQTQSFGGFAGIAASPLLWVPENHLTPLAGLRPCADSIVDSAMMFCGVPYLYGGRSTTGIDCSALVQLVMQRHGIDCPRDADQQEPVLGYAVATPRRGDVVYLNDAGNVHVGIMVDADHVLNAAVRHMGIAIEPLSDMPKFYGGNGVPAIKSIKRLVP